MLEVQHSAQFKTSHFC